MRRLAAFIAGVAPAMILGVAPVLLVSGLLKAVDPSAFREVLSRQGLLPASWLGPTTVGVWVAEVTGGLIGARCAMRRSPKFVAIGALVLGAVFLGFSAYAAALTIHPPPRPSPCGCFLGTKPVSNWGAVSARNGLGAAALGAVALFAGRRSAERASADPAFPGSP